MLWGLNICNVVNNLGWVYSRCIHGLNTQFFSNRITEKIHEQYQISKNDKILISIGYENMRILVCVLISYYLGQ